MTRKHTLIVGASGVIGSDAVEHFGLQAEACHVTALSRRQPIVDGKARFEHLPGDHRS